MDTSTHVDAGKLHVGLHLPDRHDSTQMLLVYSNLLLAGVLIAVLLRRRAAGGRAEEQKGGGQAASVKAEAVTQDLDMEAATTVSPPPYTRVVYQDWEQWKAPDGKRCFWYNRKTREKTWTNPQLSRYKADQARAEQLFGGRARGPTPWVVVEAEGNFSYFCNTDTCTKQYHVPEPWADPRLKRTDWREYVHDARLFYKNTKSGEKSYEFPASTKKQGPA